MRENIRGSKVTSGLAGLVLLLSALGLDGDPATTEAIHQFLAAHSSSIAGIIAAVALFLARDPSTKEEEEQKIAAEVRRILALVQSENPTKEK